eukprot:1143460-Pelagomonas_calceolata.AAC.6
MDNFGLRSNNSLAALPRFKQGSNCKECLTLASGLAFLQIWACRHHSTSTSSSFVTTTVSFPPLVQTTLPSLGREFCGRQPSASLTIELSILRPPTITSCEGGAHAVVSTEGAGEVGSADGCGRRAAGYPGSPVWSCARLIE